MSYDHLIGRSTFGRSLPDSLYAAQKVNVVGRSSDDSVSTDRETLWLIKVIGEVCFNVYTWKKVREHLLCFEGKLWTIIFLQSKYYVLTKLFS